MTAANPREFSFVYEERGSQSVVEQLIGTLSYGANGEIWMIEAVDESRLTTPEGEERADATDPAASLAGYNGAYDRFVGPRVSEWQSWAINIMDNN
jgi:hypothetical protein